jgi:hypothetical protein
LEAALVGRWFWQTGRAPHHLFKRETAYMLFAYRKNRQEDLSSEQLKVLKQLIELYTYER